MFRLLGLLGGLSGATDLGAGAPIEESLRRCLVATRLARALGLSDADTAEVLYTALLEHLGCTAYAHETGQVWGDDVTFTRLAYVTDFGDRKDVWGTWVAGLAESTGWSRARVLATAATAGRRGWSEGPAATCEVARDAAGALGLPDAVPDNLFHALAMWNGKGRPRTAGDAIPPATRVMHVASVAVMFAYRAGPEAAAAAVRRHAGTYLDPTLVDVLVQGRESLLGDLPEVDPFTAVLDAEPDPVRLVADEQLVGVARTFGELADLKSPYLLGHSAAVADLAARAARALGHPEDETTLRVAGHLHDLGRVAVSSGIWDKPGPLTDGERELARLHAYYGERVLARVPALAEIAVLVGQHHERCDGSGYHRGTAANRLTMTSRVLAAADAYRGLVEDRPHRAGVRPEEAGRLLRSDARRGRLDGDAVAAVLDAAGVTPGDGAGARSGGRPTRPADLTDRQVEVLRLLSHGASNREIAEQLVISRRTAEHHVQDVYAKIGASTRASAALFAMSHGLLDEAG